MWFPPKYDGCKVVETIKKNTSRSLQQKFDFLSDVYWDDKGIWSSGFFFSTVGVDDDTIQQYVAMQGREDVAQAKLEL
jgi:putative transposase